MFDLLGKRRELVTGTEKKKKNQKRLKQSILTFKMRGYRYFLCGKPIQHVIIFWL